VGRVNTAPVSFSALGSARLADGLICHPDQCELGVRPHDHCVCGLPMALGADRCALCDHEDLAPAVARPAPHPLADRWDGRSYPSRRRRRVAGSDPDAYQRLLAVVLRSPATKALSDG
jgi:hypothetical protein